MNLSDDNFCYANQASWVSYGINLDNFIAENAMKIIFRISKKATIMQRYRERD